MKKYAILLLAIVMCACGSTSGQAPEWMLHADTPQGRPLYKVTIHDGFSNIEVFHILRALEKWRDVTWSGLSSLDYMFGYEVDFAPDGTEKISGVNSIDIYKRDTITAHESTNYLGYATWNEFGAYIQLLPGGQAPYSYDDTFYRVVLHELGHTFHLPHYEGKQDSIMHPSVSSTYDLTCWDAKVFCDIWHCKPACVSQLQKNANN